MLAEPRKTITEFLVFVDFHLYYNEPDSPHGDLFESGGLFVIKQLESWCLFKGGALSSLYGILGGLNSDGYLRWFKRGLYSGLYGIYITPATSSSISRTQTTQCNNSNSAVEYPLEPYKESYNDVEFLLLLHC